MSFRLPAPEILAAPVQPEAAIAFWASRSAMTAAEMKGLAEDARKRAFYVTGLAERDAVQTVKDAIGEALKNGETLADFKERIKDVIQSQGWHDHRVETIFRNNLQTAYSAGRYQKMQAVKTFRPFWQYYTAGDERVRPPHAVLSELVFPADHPFWDSNYPPNGHKCRCGVRTLSRRQVDKEGLTVQNEMPRDMLYTDPKTGMEYHVARPGADDGWRNNPGKDWTTAGLDLKKYPDLHKDSYEEQRLRPAPVRNFEQLSEGIKRHAGKFLRNSDGFTGIEQNRKSYFMATDCSGRLYLSAQKFRTRKGEFQPTGALKSAWNKLAAGKPLEWTEEYAIESLWHEITHNRQQRTYTGKGAVNRIMETVTQWTARRTYPDLLVSLGGKAAHLESIKKEGLGYGGYIRNFDKLMRALGADEGKVLVGMQNIINTRRMDEYTDPLSALLRDASDKDLGAIKRALQKINLSDWSYEQYLRDLKLMDE